MSGLHRWYLNQLGQLEYDIVLYDKPRHNVFCWPIESRNLVFEFQRKLTPCEVKRGNTRPFNVVGSYAIYHGWKRDNQYKTGKFCHVYRPCAVDADGSRCWGRLRFDAGWMTIVWPERWLANARYPVVLDPTIGYTSIGASTDTTENYSLMIQSAAGVNGDANPGTAFYGGFSASGTITGYIGVYVFNASGPRGQAQVAASSGISITTGTGAFRSAAITWTGIAGSENRFLGTWCNNTNNRVYYDSGSANGFYNRCDSASPPDPYQNFGEFGDFDNRASCYVDFTEAGGGGGQPTAKRFGGVDFAASRFVVGSGMKGW